MTKRMSKDVNQICRHCKQLRSFHEDWVATGEYAANVICTTSEIDETGRYLKRSWFSPMTNLEYLEYKDKEHES